MAQDKIDSIVDRGAIQGEISFLESKIKEAVAAIQAAKQQNIALKVDTKSMSDYTKNVSLLNTSLQNVQKSVDGVTQATKAATSATSQQNNTLTQNIELRRRMQNSLNSHLKDEKEDLALLKAGTITRAEYNKRLTEGQIRIEQYKTKIQQLNKEIKEEIKNQGAAGSAYKEFAKQVRLAQEQAQNYAVALGKTHPQTIAATKNAKELSDELKGIDASVGIAARNVGNYGSAFSRFGKTINGILTPFRTLANILPGIGISGIFLAIFTGITSVAKAALNMGSAFNRTEAEAKAFTKALDEVKQATISASAPDITKLELYRDIITDTTRSTQERTQALNAYNKIADEANQLDVSQLNNINLINDKIAEQINLIEKRALSRAAESILADRAEKLLLAKETARASAEKSFDADVQAGQIAIAEAYDVRTKRFIKNSEEALRWEKERIVNGRIARDEAVRNAQIEFDQSKKALYGLIQQEGFAAEEIKKTKEKKAKEGRDLDEANRQAAFEILKSDLELQKELLLSRAQDDRFSYTQRAAALVQFGLVQRGLIEAQAQFELGTAKLTAKEREKIENDKANSIIRANEDLRDRLKKVLEGAFEVDTSKLGDQVKGITGAYAKIFNDLKKQTEEAGKRLIENQKKIRDAAFALAKEVAGLFIDIFQNDIERQKNEVQDQIDLLEEQKQKQIEAENSRVQTVQERADAIAVIEARAATQKAQLELRQRKLDEAKARWDRANTIANIIQQTALAVVKALPNVPLSILVGALGAVQLVRALAAPIPRYADGTDYHKGGLAVVGDGGKSEGVRLPDGTVYKTASTPTLVDLPTGSQVFPDFNTMTKAPVFSVSTDTTTQAIKSMEKNTIRAIKNIPQPIIRAEKAWTSAMRKGSSYRINYLNKHL